MTAKQTLLAIFALGTLGAATQTAAAQEAAPATNAELEQRLSSVESLLNPFQGFKISGYIQLQYQYGEKDALLNVGTNVNQDLTSGFNRIGVRRGRIKFAFEKGIVSAVFQPDFTEKGVSIKDAYLGVKDPWVGTNSIKAGVFDRPFGFEISYSSSQRESPERSTIFQTLFPDERDLGAALTLQPAKTSKWNFIKLEAGMFAGNGISIEVDNRKDFIGHLSFSPTFGNSIKLGAGVSFYNGYVYQGTPNVYTMDGTSFVLNNDAGNKGDYSLRQYFGADLQLSAIWAAGMTALRGEYLWGQQPGSQAATRSPAKITALLNNDTYRRDFSGGYVMLVQDFGTLPLSAVVKYDWYDPNTAVKGDEVGASGSNTSIVDALKNTWGIGLVWRINNNLKATAYYDFVNYEKSANIPVLAADQYEGNVFTLRLQAKL